MRVGCCFGGVIIGVGYVIYAGPPPPLPLPPPPTVPASVPSAPPVTPNAFAKGGKQNVSNEWNEKAVAEVGNDVQAQADWLKKEYDNAIRDFGKKAGNEIRQKIKQAQKAIDKRKNSGGGGN